MGYRLARSKLVLDLNICAQVHMLRFTDICISMDQREGPSDRF